MAATGPFLLTICFALLLTEVHSALQCYTKIERECSPSGSTCDIIAPPSENVPNTITECESDVTMCALVTLKGTGDGFTLKAQKASCLPKEDGVGYSNGCYDRKDLEKIDPDGGVAIKQIEAEYGITFGSIEGCICDGNLCNGSIIPAFSISVVISSLVISFMSFM